MRDVLFSERTAFSNIKRAHGPIAHFNGFEIIAERRFCAIGVTEAAVSIDATMVSRVRI